MGRNGRQPPQYVYAKRSRHSPGVCFYYGDFRRWARYGGRLQALRDGASTATTDAERARELYKTKAREFESLAVAQRLAIIPDDPRLRPMVRLHLDRRRSSREQSTVRRDAASFDNLLAYFGNRRLSQITVDRLDGYIEFRRSRPGNRKGSHVAEATIRNELNALSSLFRRAISMGKINHNPVAQMIDKPNRKPKEAVFLTRRQAAQLLDGATEEDLEVQREILRNSALGARQLCGSGDRLALIRPPRPLPGRPYPFVEAVVAALLYTGGRILEVLGLLVSDIDFVARRIRFRSNSYRTLKRPWHQRAVILWPELEGTLRCYLAASGRTDGLLFPGTRGGLMRNFTKQLARSCVRGRLPDDLLTERFGVDVRITRHSLRHTYATMLLNTAQSTEAGRPAAFSAWQVARMLGHRSSKLVEDTYGHLDSDERLMDTLSYDIYRHFPISERAPVKYPDLPPMAGESPPCATNNAQGTIQTSSPRNAVASAAYHIATLRVSRKFVRVPSGFGPARTAA